MDSRWYAFGGGPEAGARPGAFYNRPGAPSAVRRGTVLEGPSDGAEPTPGMTGTTTCMGRQIGTSGAAGRGFRPSSGESEGVGQDPVLCYK